MKPEIADLIKYHAHVSANVTHSDDPVTCALVEHLKLKAVKIRAFDHGDQYKTEVVEIMTESEFQEVEAAIEKKDNSR